MSIYIHGMDMPTKENTVILISPNGDVWTIGDMPNEDTYLLKAKAVFVSSHGDLIDRDALVRDNGIREIPEYYEVVLDAPTIIEAEEG